MFLNDIKPDVSIIIQARLGSTRFPGKVLAKLANGESVLGYLVKRLSTCRLANKVIVATTTSPKDDKLEEWLKQREIYYFRGSEENCLGRFYQTCRQFKVNIIVRITSDCPLVIPEVVDEMIRYYLDNQDHLDYLSNRQKTNFPEGVDVEIFSFKILADANRNTTNQEEREHINYYFLKRSSDYRINYFNHDSEGNYSNYKLSVDKPDELNQIRKLFEEKELPFNFSMKQLFIALDK